MKTPPGRGTLMGCNAADGGSAGRQSVTTTTSLLSRARGRHRKCYRSRRSTVLLQHDSSLGTRLGQAQQAPAQEISSPTSQLSLLWFLISCYTCTSTRRVWLSAFVQNLVTKLSFPSIPKSLSHPPWRYLKVMQIWHLGTRFSGGLARA